MPTPVNIDRNHHTLDGSNESNTNGAIATRVNTRPRTNSQPPTLITAPG